MTATLTRDESTSSAEIRPDDRITACFVTHATAYSICEELMGSKPSNAIPSNRPESGGADRDDLREKSGLLDRDKQDVAKSDAAKHREPGGSEHDVPAEG